MKLSFSKKIILIITLQTLVLGFMIFKKQMTLSNGIPILLETTPIDPRSLFRGDYVRIEYKISTIALSSVLTDEELKVKKYYFITLEKSEKFWKAVAISSDYPSLKENQTAIKGFLKRRNEYENPRLFFKYGIENYFVPEGTGMELERPEGNKKVTMKIMVDHRGDAAIKAIYVGDELKYTETLF